MNKSRKQVDSVLFFVYKFYNAKLAKKSLYLTIKYFKTDDDCICAVNYLFFYDYDI